MPHPAVSITLGVLAATAVTALVAKEVIENLDEIHDRYEAFADDLEQRHDIRLPRFRRRYTPYHTTSHPQEPNIPRYEPEQWNDQRSEQWENPRSEQWETIPCDNTPDLPNHQAPPIETDKEGSASKMEEEWSDTWTVTDGETETWSNSDFND